MILSIRLLPWLLIIVFVTLLNVERSFLATWRFLSENGPIEILSFFFALSAGLLGLKKSWLSFKQNEMVWVSSFYVFFSIVMLFIAMEEIAWGQHFLHFETPELIKKYNAQGEFTFHNFHQIQHHNEWLRLLIGLSAAIGIYLNKSKRFRKIALSNMFTGWVGLIIVHAMIDIYNDHIPINQQFDLTLRFLNEVFEMLIVLMALIYMTIKLYCETKRQTDQ